MASITACLHLVRSQTLWNTPISTVSIHLQRRLTFLFWPSSAPYITCLALLPDSIRISCPVSLSLKELHNIAVVPWSIYFFLHLFFRNYRSYWHSITESDRRNYINASLLFVLSIIWDCQHRFNSLEIQVLLLVRGRFIGRRIRLPTWMTGHHSQLVFILWIA